MLLNCGTFLTGACAGRMLHVSPTEAKLCEYFNDGEAGDELDDEKTLAQVLALDGSMFVIETDEMDGDSSQSQDDRSPKRLKPSPPDDDFSSGGTSSIHTIGNYGGTI